jgi:hypothetical protein
MFRLVRQIALVGVAMTALGCSKKTPEPTPAPAKPVATSALPAAEKAAADVSGDNAGRLDPNDPRHGTRKLMGLDAPVYVDGTQVAILRYGELPPIPVIELEGNGKRFKLYEYLKGVGIAPETIKSVHLHGNSDRIASIEGSELRKEPNRFQFSFISGDTGTPLQKWDTEHLKNEFVIHEIRRVTVYVKKPVPAIHPTRQCHVGADGDCSDEIPYATGQVAKGTRVYVDGKMMGFVKRRQMGDALIVSPPGTPAEDTRYSVAKLVAQMGVDPASIKTAELVAGDDVIARAERAKGDQLATFESQTYFTLPKHNHGKVRVHVPAELQSREAASTDRDALVSAVLLYRSTTPPKRDLVAISEDTDLSVQLAAVDDARGRLGRGE